MPIKVVSKRQKTVEVSTYGSELIAARIATELVLEFWYALRMVPVDSTSLMYGDKMSVILNTTKPSSLLKKKHLGCAYHKVRETIAEGIVTFVHIETDKNLADIMTKPLPPHKHQELVQPVLFRRPKSVTK